MKPHDNNLTNVKRISTCGMSLSITASDSSIQDASLRSAINSIDIKKSTAHAELHKVLSDFTPVREPANSICLARHHQTFCKPWNAPSVWENRIFKFDTSSNIQQLSQIMSPNDKESVKYVVCCGIEGIGRTQLVIDFIRQHADNYSYILWIPAQTAESVEITYSFLEAQLSIFSLQKGANSVINITKWLHGKRNWLVVFDDATPDLLLDFYLPGNGSCGNVLITSGSKTWPSTHKIIELCPYSLSKFELLDVGAFNKAFMEDVGRLLNSVPLALSLAVHFLRKNSTQIVDYVNLINAAKKKLKESKTVMQTLDVPVFLALNITTDAIKKISHIAQRLLTVCAFLDGNNIPVNILQDYAFRHLNVRNDNIVQEALHLLCSYSLVFAPRNSQSIVMHKIVQKIVLQALSLQEKNDYLIDIQSTLDGIWFRHQGNDQFCLKTLVQNISTFVQHVEQSIAVASQRRAALKETYLIPALWMVQDAYKCVGLYHSQVVTLKRIRNLSKQRERYCCAGWNLGFCSTVSTNERLANVFASALMLELGIAYMKLLDFEKSNKFLMKSLREQQLTNSSNGNMGHIYSCLGSCNLGLKKAHAALDCLHKALQINNCTLGAHSIPVAETWLNIAKTQKMLFAYNEERSSIQTALILLKDSVPISDQRVIKAIVRLSEVYEAQDDVDTGCSLLEVAYAVSHFMPEKFTKIRVRILTKLSTVYVAMNQTKLQCQMLKQALSFMVVILGASHADVAELACKLAVAYGSRGKLQKEFEILKQALVHLEAFYGNGHVLVARTLNNLGVCYGKLGDYKKEIEYLDRALVIKQANYGGRSIEVAKTYNNLGIAYGCLKNHTMEITMLKKALEIKQQQLGSDHPDLAPTINNIANAYGRLGHYTLQKAMLEKVLAVEEKHFGLQHENVALTLYNLGNAYENLEEYDKQRKCLVRALAIQAHKFGNKSEQTISTRYSLAKACQMLNNYNEEIEQLMQIISIDEQRFGSKSAQLIPTLKLLCQANFNSERYDTWHQVLQKLLQLLLFHEGIFHTDVQSVAKDWEKSITILNWVDNNTLIDQFLASEAKTDVSQMQPYSQEVLRSLYALILEFLNGNWANICDEASIENCGTTLLNVYKLNRDSFSQMLLATNSKNAPNTSSKECNVKHADRSNTVNQLKPKIEMTSNVLHETSKLQPNLTQTTTKVNGLTHPMPLAHVAIVKPYINNDHNNNLQADNKTTQTTELIVRSRNSAKNPKRQNSYMMGRNQNGIVGKIERKPSDVQKLVGAILLAKIKDMLCKPEFSLTRGHFLRVTM